MPLLYISLCTNLYLRQPKSSTITKVWFFAHVLKTVIFAQVLKTVIFVQVLKTVIFAQVLKTVIFAHEPWIYELWGPKTERLKAEWQVGVVMMLLKMGASSSTVCKFGKGREREKKEEHCHDSVPLPENLTGWLNFITQG